MVQKLARAFVGSCVLLAGACGDDIDVCAIEQAPASVELASARVGVGAFEYLALENSASLEAHRGNQGGYHIYISFAARGLYPGPIQEIERAFGSNGSGSNSSPELRKRDPVMTYTLVDVASGAVIAQRQLQQPLRPEGDVLTRIGDLLVFTDVTSAAQIEGKVVDFSMSIVDVCGVEASDAITDLTVTVVDD